MPLTINVGLSRKASRDYQSTGVSINITAELDQALLAKPDELQAQVSELYGQAEEALSRQTKQATPNSQTRPNQNRGGHERYPGGTGGNGSDRRGNGRRNDYQRGPGRNGHSGANSGGGGHSGTSGGGGMTQSQRRAIESIAQRLDLDAAAEIEREFGWSFDELTLREASQVIDHLKAMQPAERDRD